MTDSGGYSGPSQRLLNAAGVTVGDVISIDLEGQEIKGTLAPRYQYDDDSHVVIKLKNGYNIGLAVDKISKIAKLESGEKPGFASSPPPPREGLPEVAVLSTGGTIASRVDYRTGAVHAAISSGELYSLIPELSDIARIRPEVVLRLLSENLEPADWGTIASKVVESVKNGASGVVVTTGTDVMGYTSAALAFALQGIPVPVLVVGSQRSSDRPSSDAYLNLIGAVTIAANADLSGVYLVMHADSSDDRLAVHGPVRVRKNHTSARDAFQSIGAPPLAYWTPKGLVLTSGPLPPRSRPAGVTAKPAFEPRVALVKFYPSMAPSSLDGMLSPGLKGVVIEGTGLGHVSTKSIPVLRSFVERGGIACMTSQCIWGRVDMNVYETGRDLLQAGVLPLEDTIPETALVKLMWVLANTKSTDEAKSLMRKSIVGEMTERSLPTR